MRQQLPADAGYPLHSAEAGTIWPGDEFDAPAPVPGCVPLGRPPATDGPEPAQETPAGPSPATAQPDPAADGTGPHSATDTGRAPGRSTSSRSKKEPRP